MRRALLIGIDNYPDPYSLNGCVADVNAFRTAIERNGDGSENFNVEELINEPSSKTAMGAIEAMFSIDLDVALLYFSGHGCANTTGSEIVFPNDIANDGYYNGLQMRSIMDVVNKSKAKNKIIILDCCHAGDMGRYHIDIDNSDLRTGVSILTACRGGESAVERGGHGVFTDALCMALSGAAADFSGNITIGSIYSYIDRYFSITEQRPVFKTNTTEFVALKKIAPKVSSDIIKEGLIKFLKEDDNFPLDPSYEKTNSVETRTELRKPYSNPDNVAKMEILQALAGIGFVEPVGEDHMYFAAMNSKSCRLTELGKYYWRLVQKGLI